MATTWNRERWNGGINEAGDVVYERNVKSSAGSGVAAKTSSSISKTELQALAAARGLATSGTKADLIARLSGVGS